MKTELQAVRNTNVSLRKQVKRLKSVVRVHIPSVAVGVLAGALVRNYWPGLKQLFTRLKAQVVQNKGQAAQDEAQEAEQVKALEEQEVSPVEQGLEDKLEEH